MVKRIAAIQSSYIPWKGYFDLLASVDEFILFDDVQFTRRDWRSRNQIKTKDGLLWLTVPVDSKGKYLQKIKDVQIADARWNDKHWTTIRSSYAKATHFADYKEPVEELFRGATSTSLSEINHRLTTGLASLLGIDTEIRSSMDYKIEEGKNQRLISLCQQAGATEYVSGPSASSYLDEELFRENGLSVSFFSYDGYPEYRQLHGPFEHFVTVLDLLFNQGPTAREFMLVPPKTTSA